MAVPVHKRDYRHPDSGFQWKPPPPKGPLPLPLLPRSDKSPPTAPVLPDDKHAPEQGRPVVDKFAALKTYRRVRGLCDKCAERWRPGHQCASIVQLHVVQELMDLLSSDFGDSVEVSDGAEGNSGASSVASDQVHLFAALSLRMLLLVPTGPSQCVFWAPFKATSC